ncbi:class I SAM-dependent methyltransferase [Georgenia sp. H159]|uniref:class I SAM-dependent methyltransferase n=1 Tax=Georgenia sp. H159 TaxID=3076115 RepID=UPI002D77BF9E|nr:class I SAM-dependent methyltransferase [Georgenia sp. H159]
MTAYWNHNTAYHPEITRAARARGGRVLDVGCGEGLLLERLSTAADQVVGIDPDAHAVGRAQQRLAGVAGARVVRAGLLDDDVPALGRFDTVTCVATLHHLPLRPALERLRGLVAPGGQLIVVGLAANRSALDWVVSGAQVLPVRVLDVLHRARGDVGVAMADPVESVAEIRAAAAELLPGSRLRRRCYFRYTLTFSR